MNSKNFKAILRNILRIALRIKLRKILRTLVNEAPELSGGHSQKILTCQKSAALVNISESNKKK